MNSSEYDLEELGDNDEDSDEPLDFVIEKVRIFLFNDQVDGIWLLAPIAAGGTVVNAFMVGLFNLVLKIFYV